MLQANKDDDDEVALEACEFWSAYCDAQFQTECLGEFLPRLIPVLLSNMVYADDDESLVDAEEDESFPDRDQDLKPRFHSSRFHGADNMEDDDDDIVNIWNLRKCSAAALDILSNVFGDEILPTLMPLVQAKLATADDNTWKDREAAVLAIGAIAEGCINGLYPHLSEMVVFLIPLLDDKFPLIRSITCWTLSRYSKFVVQGIGHQKGHEQFEKVLMGLLRRVLDTNKRVQEAACSAFATLEEEAAKELVPRLEVILQHLLCAFGKYQKRNLRMVYDAIGTLADAVGGELNQPRYLDILMPPLISKWQQLSNSDKDLFPLLECFTSIAQALGPGFSQFAEPVFQRCINLIQTQQLAKVQQDISPIALRVVECLVPILKNAEGLNKSLVENSAITLGRLAWVCPDLVSPHMDHFMQPWCTALSMIRDDIEKEDAFRGLCALVRENPTGALSSLVYMCKAIASWHEIRSEDLHNGVCHVLNGYKQMLRNGAWEQCMSLLEPPVKDKLSKYQV
uniref:Importin subunit beta-1/Transportin-1-like TPR repeats domain-containing protein n=1 Tax=Nelumbo nucifera TaxID=4432 RepID=A0A822Z777_NELNU|nr:TPA_asm: hypothetical protein HUJ06_013582 [Nelumbo nucifera]